MRRRGKSAINCSAPPGKAQVFKLEDVDRVDQPGGSDGGSPGLPASHYLKTSVSAIGEVAVTELFGEGTEYVLYSVEDVDTANPKIVFLTLPSSSRSAMWLTEAFIDRGIRKQVMIGAKVAVTSLASVEKVLADPMTKLCSGEWSLSFVWNTGRCGSTLLHRAISSLGVVSLSEPHWLDQLQYQRRVPEKAAALKRVLSVCVAAEVTIARRQKQIAGWSTATKISFNPKAGGAEVIAPAVAGAFPHARHVFMYRACHKVVESFTGLKFSAGLPLALQLMWRIFGTSALRSRPATSTSLGHLDVGLAQLSSLPVAELTARWIGVIATWVELQERRRAGASSLSLVGDPIGSALNVRMDEFTSKDMAVRTSVLRSVLSHFGLVATNAKEPALAPALKAFETNSQVGSSMSGEKVKIVQKADVPAIARCVQLGLASSVKAHGVIVEQDGANVLLPRSLGVPPRA